MLSHVGVLQHVPQCLNCLWLSYGISTESDPRYTKIWILHFPKFVGSSFRRRGGKVGTLKSRDWVASVNNKHWKRSCFLKNIQSVSDIYINGTKIIYWLTEFWRPSSLRSIYDNYYTFSCKPLPVNRESKTSLPQEQTQILGIGPIFQDAKKWYQP